MPNKLKAQDKQKKADPSPSSTIMIAATSGLVALVDPKDAHHADALRFVGRMWSLTGTILVPSNVFSEMITVLSEKRSLQLAALAGGMIMSQAGFFVVDTPSDVWKEALTLFADQPGSVRFTNCMVMAFAKAWGTRKIFGFDAVFAEDGYQTHDQLPKAA